MNCRRVLWLPVLILAINLTGCGKRETPLPAGDAPPLTADAPREIGPPVVEESPPAAAPMSSAVVADNPSPGQPASQTVVPAGPGTAAPQGLPTLSCIGEDAAVVILIRPAQILANGTVQDLIAAVDSIAPESGIAVKLEEMGEQLGADISAVDHLLVVSSSDQFAELPRLFGPVVRPAGTELRMLTMALHFQEGIDPARILSEVSSGERIEVAGLAARRFYDGSLMYAAGPRTLVVSEADRRDAIIANAEPGRLASHMSSLADKDLAIVMDMLPVRTALARQAGRVGPNPAMMMAMGLMQQVQSVAVALDLAGETLLTVRMETLNSDAAQGIHQSLAGLLEVGKQQFTKTRFQTPSGVEMVEIQEFAARLVNGARVDRDEARVTFAVPRPEGFERLGAILEPALAEASRTAVLVRQQNSLKQIGLAFHNFHDTFGYFPAPDSNGGQGNELRGSGLSWRVHLLPYLEALPLYNRFRLDEPWDSEHNLTLVGEMPEIFGKDPEGRTSLHVFIGEGTPFKMEQRGPGIREFTDGTSNTLLVVMAGADKAETWTKPGGLPLERKDPFAALGDVGDQFLVLFADGSVRPIAKSVGAEIFSLLIQHADGQPVTLP